MLIWRVLCKGGYWHRPQSLEAPALHVRRCLPGTSSRQISRLPGHIHLSMRSRNFACRPERRSRTHFANPARTVRCYVRALVSDKDRAGQSCPRPTLGRAAHIHVQVRASDREANYTIFRFRPHCSFVSIVALVRPGLTSGCTGFRHDRITDRLEGRPDRWILESPAVLRRGPNRRRPVGRRIAAATGRGADHHGWGRRARS